VKDLKGKVAALTGAASGIGRNLAIVLAGEGCHLAISDINEKGLKETLGMLSGKPVKVSTAVVDVSKRDQVHKWADDVVKEHGQVDLIINNAGVAVYETLENVSYEDFEWLFGINFWGVVYGTKAFLPHLRKRPEGHIVNISSINGMVPFPFNGPYNAAKFAIRGFNKTLIQELRGSTIRITSVHPGGIKTEVARSARFRKQAGDDLTHTDIAEIFDFVARMTADVAARKIVNGVKRNRERLFIGYDARFMDLMSRLAPVTTTKVTGAIYYFLQKRKMAAKKKA